MSYARTRGVILREVELKRGHFLSQSRGSECCFSSTIVVHLAEYINASYDSAPKAKLQFDSGFPFSLSECPGGEQ